MTFEDMKKLDRSETAVMYVMSFTQLYRQRLNKISLYRCKNDKGNLTASITCFLTDTRGSLHTLNFRLFDDQYIWFLNSIERSFPETEFEDLTPEEYKVLKTGGEQHDVQTGKEA